MIYDHDPLRALRAHSAGIAPHPNDLLKSQLHADVIPLHVQQATLEVDERLHKEHNMSMCHDRSVKRVVVVTREKASTDMGGRRPISGIALSWTHVDECKAGTSKTLRLTSGCWFKV